MNPRRPSVLFVPFILISAACSKSEPPAPSVTSAASASVSPTNAAPATSAARSAGAGNGAVSAMRIVTKDGIPKGIAVESKIEKAVTWTDKNGENFAIFSRRETTKKSKDETLESGYLDVKHVVMGEPPKVLRHVKDQVEKCDADMLVEFRDAALELTDLDKDGIGELTFAYALTCASDMTPAELKLLTIENGDKYILRGWTRMEAQGTNKPSGGEFTVDPSFKSGPPAFFEHAKASWLKVRPHSDDDAKIAKTNKGGVACARVPWKAESDEHASADVKGLAGKLYQGEGGNWTGGTEKYLVVTLDTPICDHDTAASVPEIQVNALDTSESDMKKLVGKRVTVSGLASSAATVHDHRPIVVSGKVKAL